MLKRQTLRDYSDYSLKQINDNFMGIFLKLGGNIDYMDMRDGAIITDKIRDGAVTGDKILEGTLSIIHVDDEFVSGIDLLENPTFLSLSNTVDVHEGELSNHTTAIQQNSKEIKLSAERISSNAYNISELKITADGLKSTVQGLSRDVDSLNGDVEYAFSEIEQTANKISTKVGYGDVISSINQSSESISINANKIDLTGITTIYDSNSSKNYINFNGGSFGLYTNGISRLSIYPDISMVKFSGNPIQFQSSVYFDGTVDFSKANVVGVTSEAIFG